MHFKEAVSKKLSLRLLTVCILLLLVPGCFISPYSEPQNKIVKLKQPIKPFFPKDINHNGSQLNIITSSNTTPARLNITT